VLVDAKRLDALQPVGTVSSTLGFDLERVPQGVPVDVEPAGERSHGGVVVGERVRCPDHGPAGQQRPRRRQSMRLSPDPPSIS
jgi:hypothetical protein